MCTINGSAAVCPRSSNSDIFFLVMFFESRTVHLSVLAAMSVTFLSSPRAPWAEYRKSAWSDYAPNFQSVRIQIYMYD